MLLLSIAVVLVTDIFDLPAGEKVFRLINTEMPILTREQRKLDFEHVMSMLELEPEDSAYKLFMALTQNAKRMILPIMQMNKAELKDLKAECSEGKSLTFDPW